jgi:hypothetical protein
MHRAIGIVNLELAGKVWRHHGGEVTFILPSPCGLRMKMEPKAHAGVISPFMDEDNDGE